MKKKFTTATVAASVLGGIAIGSFAVPPMTAFAADTSTTASSTATARTPGQWITDSLKGLVDKGTITQSQSDTIASTLKSAEPKGGHGGPGGRGGADISIAATSLGMNQADLRTAMQTKSLADIAKDKNVDVQKVIDALVTAQNKHIDQEVTDGELTQAQADVRKAATAKRVTDDVNTLRPMRGHDGPDSPDANDTSTSAS